MDPGLMGILVGMFLLGVLLVWIGWVGQIAEDIEGDGDSPWRFHR